MLICWDFLLIGEYLQYLVIAYNTCFLIHFFITFLKVFFEIYLLLLFVKIVHIAYMFCRNFALPNFDTWSLFYPWISSVAGKLNELFCFCWTSLVVITTEKYCMNFPGEDGYDWWFWIFFASSPWFRYWYYRWSKWN